MERLHCRSTTLVGVLAELRQRELLDEAHARRRAALPDTTARRRLPGLSMLRRRILG